MARLLAFVLSLLLLAGTVDPTRGWMIVLTVLAGLGALRLRPWRMFNPQVRLDLRLASFAMALVLLAQVVEPARDWLIVMAVVSGLAAFMPRLIALDGHSWARSFDDRTTWRRWDRWGSTR